jgi:hypothetical protein
MKKFFFSLIGLAIAASAYAVIPADPTNVSWYDSHAENGFSRLDYTLPQTDIDGNDLPDLENLGFRVFTDNDQLFTFEASVYTNDLYSDMTEIYYWVYAGNGYDFNGDHTYFYRTNWEGFDPFFSWRIGIQAVYNDNGVKTYSNIVYTEVFPQATLPKPGNPKITEWIDSEPYVFDPEFYMTNCMAGYTLAYDSDQNPVADDYTSEKEDHGEPYTILEPEKVSFSLFTDNDQIFTFTPDMYPGQVNEPITQFPFTSINANGYVGWWMIDFEGMTNHVDVLAEGGIEAEPFFTWRIGIQTYYTDNGQTSASDIVYMEIYPQLKEAANITSTSFLADWSCEAENTYLINNFIGDGCGYFLHVIDKATQEEVLVQYVETTNAIVDSVGKALEFQIPGAFYTVEGLTPGNTYQYYVEVIQNTGASYSSVVREVTLPAEGHGYDPGDVNHDHNISIADVTALIDYLLGNTEGACTICADVNQDTNVSIGDVTALIDILLAH